MVNCDVKSPFSIQDFPTVYFYFLSIFYHQKNDLHMQNGREENNKNLMDKFYDM
jgi:hypothetical protein